ncbi:hypothetical protein MNEG_15521, partial [Monoraphidium neglectum]
VCIWAGLFARLRMRPRRGPPQMEGGKGKAGVAAAGGGGSGDSCTEQPRRSGWDMERGDGAGVALRASGGQAWRRQPREGRRRRPGARGGGEARLPRRRL